jgi:Tfp pilus assembly protein PilO
MSSGYWSNLRPFEKRVVVGIGVLFFIVLNFLFIIPHFSDLAAVNDRMAEARRKLARYQNEFSQTNTYAARLREFEQENSDVPAEEQMIQFVNKVQTQAVQSGVHLNSGGRINTQTNLFFLEKTQSVGVVAGEQQLVDFLYNLGSGNSQVRVRDLSVHPDPPHQQLNAQITLVASYQKKSATRPATRPASAPGTHAEAAPTTPRSPLAAAKD